MDSFLGNSIHFKMQLVIVLLLFSFCFAQRENFLNFQLYDENLQLLLEKIMIKTLTPYKCIAVITDDIHRQRVFQTNFYEKFDTFISFIMIQVEEYEDLLAPATEIQDSLILARNEDCQLYIIFLANGLQTSRLLKFCDKYRLINTRSKFAILFDNRLFEKNLYYLWKRVINVIFIRRFENSKKPVWFEITTVPFPAPINTILVPRRLDIWTKGKFRTNVDLYRDKTSDLRNQTLKVAVFSHLPGTSKLHFNSNGTQRTILGNSTVGFIGAEIEILQTVSKAMNFWCETYEPLNVETEMWGQRIGGGGIYTGLIGEMVRYKADIALGDLYYTPYILDLMDLSLPYNTECLTFLTPEALTDISWKTLILPFTPEMWGAIVVCLLVCGVVFFILAKFHQHVSDLKTEKNVDTVHIKKKRVITLTMYPDLEKLEANAKYTKMKELYIPPKYEGQTIGLYQFSQLFNSILYTYSMLLLVSLPKLPTGWSLRLLTGWYWLYCLLLVVSYRASMTAILSRPTPRVTIDSLEALIDSLLPCGGWGEINQQFFNFALDPATKTIGSRFEIVNDSAEAVDRVAAGKFAFYENEFFLKEAVFKRQLRLQNFNLSEIANDESAEARVLALKDRSLHIMSDCVIKMPISIGLQKNSPIKPRMDKFIRRVLEAGLIQKWLNDVMTSVINSNSLQKKSNDGTKALMNLQKFVGAIVALFIGYCIGIVVLVVEIVYFRKIVMKHPNYNKYTNIVEVKQTK